MSQNPYTENFFVSIQESSLKSAKEIIPLVIELLHPQSVIDVGCGLGTWLSVFQAYGVEDILGVDGDYIDKEKLQIPPEKFFCFELNKPLQIERKFDLVISLEVAEHLRIDSAELFVESLTKLGKVILFSAAIPFQGGEDHFNEQWQEYWVEHFKQRGYLPIDYIRRKVWQNKNVAFWYAQNTLIFVDFDYLESNHLLKEEFHKNKNSQYNIVHPKKYITLVDQYLSTTQAIEWYAAAADPRNMSLKEFLLAFPIVAVNGVKRTINNLFV